MTGPFESPTLFSAAEEPQLQQKAESASDEHDWTVSELHAELSSLIEGRFGARTWVTGELRSLNRSPKGHTYFELVDPVDAADGGDTVYNAPRLNVTLFAGRRKRVNTQITEAGGRVRIEDGTTVRICGEIRSYPARSSVQMLMTGIDPGYTLGVVGQRREAVLAALRAEDLLDLNAALTVPTPAMRLAVVTSTGSAAAADTLHELESAGIGFHVLLIDARTQGAEAEETLVAALHTAEQCGADLTLLVRGGGSANDLSVFDSETLARTIASLSVPVFTGIGHETDHSVADEVAHSAHKTPTAAAAAVVSIALDARRDLEAASASVRTAAAGTLRRHERDLTATAQRTSFACRAHVEREARLLDTRLAHISSIAPVTLDRLTARLARRAERVAAAAPAALDRAAVTVAAIASLVQAHDPHRMMERGWSLTHDSAGNLVRYRGDVAEGDVLATTVTDGRIISTVSATNGT